MANYQETSNLKLYLTSLEPDISQSIYSQSIGGYISTSLVYPETTVLSTVGLYDEIIYLNTPTGGWSDWADIEYISIGNEIIQVEGITSGTINVVKRGLNGVTSVHLEDNVCIGISTKKIFNNVFNDDYKQYRCIAVKNTSENWIMSGGLIYIKQNCRNPNSEIRIAIEVPKNKYTKGTSSSWDNNGLVDTTLIGQHSDNYFQNSYLVIRSGPNINQGRIINSYDNDNGSFIVSSSFPYDYNESYSQYVEYTIEPSPSQRIKTGTISPITGTDLVSIFSKTDQYYPISINVQGINGGDYLYPNNIFYIWLERTINKGSNLFDNDNIILTIKFSGTAS